MPAQSERSEPKTRLRRYHKVYLIRVGSAAYTGRTSYEDVRQRLREHLGEAMKLPLLQRAKLEPFIKAHLLSYHESRDDAKDAEQAALARLRRDGVEVFNLCEASNGSLSAEELQDFHAREFEPEPTVGPVSGVLIRHRERTRLELEQAMEQALMRRAMSPTELARELARGLARGTGAVNRSIYHDDGAFTTTARGVKLTNKARLMKQPEDYLRNTLRKADEDEQAENAARHAAMTEAEEMARILDPKNPTKLRTDWPKRGEQLIALLWNFTIDAQRQDGEPPRFPDMVEWPPPKIGPEERAQAAQWQDELLTAMKRLRETKPERAAELNAFKTKAEALARKAGTNEWTRGRAQRIMQEMSPPAEGATATYYVAPFDDPDF